MHATAPGAMIVVWFFCWCVMVQSHVHLKGLNVQIPEIMQLHKRFETYQRQTRNDVDLREHRLFTSNTELDCCPTTTELSQRAAGINPQGLLLELLNTRNFTQTFYETRCHPTIKNRPCQFLDRKYSASSRCIQQYSYVYAMGRTFGHWFEQFWIDYIRIATGCKCQLTEDLVSDYKAEGPYLNNM